MVDKEALNLQSLKIVDVKTLPETEKAAALGYICELYNNTHADKPAYGIDAMTSEEYRQKVLNIPNSQVFVIKNESTGEFVAMADCRYHNRQTTESQNEPFFIPSDEKGGHMKHLDPQLRQMLFDENMEGVGLVNVVITDPAFRKQGVMKEALRKIYQEFQKVGNKFLVAEVGTANDASLALFASLGYKIAGLNIWSHNNQLYPYFLMVGKVDEATAEAFAQIVDQTDAIIASDEYSAIVQAINLTTPGFEDDCQKAMEVWKNKSAALTAAPSTVI